MKRLVVFQLDQGGSVLVEVDDPPGGPVMRGIGKDRPAVQLSAQTGAFITSVAAEADFKVSMTWRHSAVQT